ncbi:MAG: glycosyltransferase family 2 protein [Ferruginibacter sp.]
MRTFPKITIVTPNYNYGHFLEQTILSVINQGYANLEYIIIDGGSTDNSIEIIKKYERHLAYWVSEPDKGMYDAINKGFDRSTGDIMAWLNSDDMYFPWALKVVSEVFAGFSGVQWLSTLQPGAVDYNGYILDFGRFEGFNRDAFREGYHADNKFAFGFIQQESTFWRKELWEKAGAYVSTEVSMAGDFELWNRFFFWANLHGLVSPLSMFRFQHRQQTSAQDQYAAQCNKILRSFDYAPTSSGTLRRIIKKGRLDRVPGLMHIIKSKLGFETEIVVRGDRELPTGKWQIKKRQFM